MPSTRSILEDRPDSSELDGWSVLEDRREEVPRTGVLGLISPKRTDLIPCLTWTLPPARGTPSSLIADVYAGELNPRTASGLATPLPVLAARGRSGFVSVPRTR